MGIGSKFNESQPIQIKEFDPHRVDGVIAEDDYVVEISGGEHHSIARTFKGLVYCWGRNDEGQIGQGDTYGDWQKKKKQEEAEQEQLRIQEEQKLAAQKEAEE